LSEPTKIKGFQASYSSFLATSYHILFQLWLNGNLRGLWRGIKGFYTFLPTEVKDRINPEIEQVDEGIDKIMNKVQGPDLFTTDVRQTEALTNYLYKSALPILDQIIRLLDEKDWLVRGGHYLKGEDFKKLEEETDES